MPINNAKQAVVASVATVVAAASLFTLYMICPEAMPDTIVVHKHSPTVVVNNPPVVPPPGVPAYAVPVGQPCVINYHTPEGIRVPRAYKYKYVVYHGTHYPLVNRNGCLCYQVGNCFYPVRYF